MIDNEVSAQTWLLEKLLDELNPELGMDIRICPGYTSGLRADKVSSLGYKLCKQGETPQRRLNLVIDRCTSDGSQYLRVKSELRSAILAFWDKGNTAFNWTKTIVY